MSNEFTGNEYLRRLQGLDAESNMINFLIDDLLRMGTRDFTFTGSGEPFMHKNVLEFMGRSKHAGCICSVNTNGTLLDRETIDELIKMEFNDLRITTMAGTSDMYMRTHPGVANTAFDNLKDNLLYLKERKAALGVRYPEITLACVVVAQNCIGLFDFAKFASLIQANRVRYRPVYDIGDDGLAELVPTKEQAEYVSKQLIEVIAYLESKRITHNIRYFLKVFKKDLDTTALYDIIPCYYGWLGSRVEVDGLVYPCCRCYESLGNVHKNDFHEIWNGEAYRRFRKEAFKINKRKSSVTGCECYGCPHYIANLRAYRMLHPLKSRSSRLESLQLDLSDNTNSVGP